MKTPAIYLNENIEIEVLDLLKAQGIDAVHTIRVGNRGKDDEFQLKYAATGGMIVLTHNRYDFRKLHRDWIAKRKEHCGILLVGCVGPQEVARRTVEFIRNRLSSINASFCETLPI